MFENDNQPIVDHSSRDLRPELTSSIVSGSPKGGGSAPDEGG
jgi:hypothetical protein